MNIVFYKRRIKKLKKVLKSGKSKYMNKRLENWIIKCRRKIEEIKHGRKRKR